MVSTHILGYPRVGERRELKFALEAFWRGESEAILRRAGATLRARRSRLQASAGLRFVTAGDFSYYDHVLDHAALLGCLPRRFALDARHLTLRDYFVLARGDATRPALEMTKWFDTNYHYLVPEIDGDACYEAGPDWYFDEIREALALGTAVKPVLVGPLTFLRLSKIASRRTPRDLIEPLAARYAVILERLNALGIEWVQIDEPALCMDLAPDWLEALTKAYETLAAKAPKLLLTTYFDDVAEYCDRIVRLPVNGVHLDLVRAPTQFPAWRNKLPCDWVLSAGIVDGRNVDAAANDVRDRVARVRAVLPEAADDSVVSKIEADAQAIMWLAFNSERHGTLELSDYADRYIADRLKTLPGVASVIIGGNRRYAMRIWLDRDRLAAFALTLPQSRLEEALAAQLAARGVTVRWNHRLAGLAEQLRRLVARRGDERRPAREAVAHKQPQGAHHASHQKDDGRADVDHALDADAISERITTPLRLEFKGTGPW